MAKSILPPIHPGEVLKEEFLEPYEMSSGGLARALYVPRTRIERIVSGQTAITPDTALRLARFFRTAPEFWMNLQTNYDLKVEAASLKDDLRRIDQVKAA